MANKQFTFLDTNKKHLAVFLSVECMERDWS